MDKREHPRGFVAIAEFLYSPESTDFCRVKTEVCWRLCDLTLTKSRVAPRCGSRARDRCGRSSTAEPTTVAVRRNDGLRGRMAGYEVKQDDAVQATVRQGNCALAMCRRRYCRLCGMPRSR